MSGGVQTGGTSIQYQPFLTAREEVPMAELLLEGSRGEEVRRLQRNLNAALANQVIILDGKNILPLETRTGIFGKRTKAAVIQFQRDFKLKLKDGKVGDENP